MRLFAQLVNPSVILRLAALGLGLQAMACSDDAAAATAEGVNWKLSATAGGLSGAQSHDPTMDTLDYKVSCSKDQAGWQISIEDPGREALTSVEMNGANVTINQRTRSVLTIKNITATACDVLVQEGAIGMGQPKYTGSCTAGTCQLTGQKGPVSGYDFQASLICSGLTKEGTSGQQFTLGSTTSAGAGAGGVALNLNNCD